jgi:hypothetical protein
MGAESSAEEPYLWPSYMVKDMASNPLTSIPVHADVVHRLRTLKTADQTWDDFLIEMARDYVPAGWYEEMERRRREGDDVPGRVVLRRSRELARRGR